MRRLWFALALGLAPLAASCGYAPTGAAQQTTTAIKAPFALTGRVVDNAGLLLADDRQTLVQRLEALQRTTGPQLVVVTVPELKDMTIEQLGLALGNGWGIGDSRRNDGVLMIVAPKEHQTRIEVGKGLEATLTNALCAEIIEHDMIPQFREGHFKAGIDAGVDRLIAALSTRPART